MEKETKHTPEFDLPKLKKQVDTARKAAEFYIQMHNPHQNLANEPYNRLVIGATNDFLKLYAAGFCIVTETELSEMKKEREELIEAINKYAHHWYKYFGDPKVGQPPGIEDLTSVLSRIKK